MKNARRARELADRAEAISLIFDSWRAMPPTTEQVARDVDELARLTEEAEMFLATAG